MGTTVIRLITGWTRLCAAARKIPLEYWLLLIGATGHILFRIVNFRIIFDPVRLLAGGMNLLRGGGVSLIYADPRDLSATLEFPLVHWPPGFSLAIAGLTKLLGSPYAAMVSFDVFFMAMFFGACGWLLFLMGPVYPRRARLLFVWTIAFVAPSYLSFDTNLAILAMFLLSLALLLPHPDGRPPTLGACALAGGLLSGAISFRYAALPFALTPFLFLGFDAWRDRAARRRLLAAAAGWILMIAPLVWWKFAIVPENALDQLLIKLKWYPANLLRFHPVAGDALFGHFLDRNFPDSHYYFYKKFDITQFLLRHLLSVFVLLAAVVGIHELLKAAKSRPENVFVRRILLEGIAASLGTIALLLFLTLFHPPTPWVYVEESRYFSICFPFIVLGAAYVAAIRTNRIATRALKSGILLAFLCAGALYVADAPGALRRFRRGLPGQPVEFYFRPEGGFAREIQKLFSKEEKNVVMDFSNADVFWEQRRSIVSYFGVPFSRLSPGEKVHTSRDVFVVAFCRATAFVENFNAFNEFCREHKSTPTAIHGFEVCSFLLPAGS